MNYKLKIAAFAVLAIAMAWPALARERLTVLTVEIEDRPVIREVFEGAMTCGNALAEYDEWIEFFDVARCVPTGAPVRSPLPVMRPEGDRG